MDVSGRGSLLLTRFGIPLILLLFYVTAVRHFGVTSDESFLTVLHARAFLHDAGQVPPVPAAGTPSPAWLLLLAVGETLGLDVLLTAKAFSLLFTSFALLGLYLLAVEVLSDRLVAVGVVIVVAAHGWLLGAAASGSAAGVALAGSLISLFFWQRREPLLAVLVSSLTSLIFWQSLVLVAAQLVTVVLRGESRTEALRAGIRVGAVATVILGGWCVYAFVRGLSPFPVLLFAPAPGGTVVLDFLALGIAGGFSLAWLVLVFLLRAWADLRAHSLLVVWMLWLAALTVREAGATLLLFPLLVLLAVPGCLALVAVVIGRRPGFGVALVPVALLLLLVQTGYLTGHRPDLAAAEAEINTLATAAGQIRVAVPDSTTVASDRPWALWYFSDRPVVPLVMPPAAGAVVTVRDSLPGYHRVGSLHADVPGFPSAPPVQYHLWLHNPEGTR